MTEAVARGQADDPVLLERDDELAMLARLVAATGRRGGHRGSFALIEGPGGIGKTALLDALCELARKQDLCVVRARGGELEQEFPYGIARQLFEPALMRASAGTDGGERATLLAGAARLAEPLLVDAAAPESEGAARASAFAAQHGLYWLTANLAAQQPLVIAVDDAQWADTGSLRFLVYLARRVGELPIVLVVAARAAEAGASAELFAQLAASDPEALLPRPLSEDSCAAIVRDRLGADADAGFCLACHRAAGGNPFLLGELLSALVSEGVPATAEQVPRVEALGPRSVSRALLHRVARLSPSAAPFARAVAVLNGHATRVDAARLAELDAEDSARTCAALVDAGVLRGDPFEFVQPIVRAAVYADLPDDERASLHGRAARILLAEGAPADRVATHLLATDPADDAVVVETLRDAARAALARGVTDAAVAYLRRALLEPPEAAQRAGVLFELGRAEARNHEAGADEHLRQALALTTGSAERARVAIELGRALFALDRAREAVAVLDEAIAAVAPDDPDLALELEAELIGAARLQVSMRGLIGDRLERMAHQVRGDGPGQRLLVAHLAYESAMSGESAERTRLLATRALADGRLLEQVTSDALTLQLCALALGFAGELEAALSHFDQFLDDARERGSAHGFALSSCFRAIVNYRRGALADAEADAVAALAIEADHGWHIGVPIALASLIDVLVDRGDLDGAARALHAGLGDRIPEHTVFIAPLYARGRLRLAQGSPREALDDLLACGRRQNAWGSRNPAVIPWRSTAALAVAALHQDDDAGELAAEEVDRARTFGEPRALGVALRAAGIVAAGKERESTLREAADVLEQAGAPLELARALTDLGSALRASGDTEGAREALRRARELAHSTGAMAVFERAQDELIATGARPRRATLSGPDALTPSERRVAEIAAAGQTNREIAQALFLTEKTIELHLSNAYRKLGIRSRAQLARALGGSEESAPEERAD
jgi:DNA-binding CsgD family transcriptional regulator